MDRYVLVLGVGPDDRPQLLGPFAVDYQSEVGRKLIGAGVAVYALDAVGEVTVTRLRNAIGEVLPLPTRTIR